MENKLKFINKFFWFLKDKADNLNLEKDKGMIIHQTLALGSMSDFRKLLKIYGQDVMRTEFQKPAKGLYHPAVLELFQYLLKVKVDKSNYIKNIHGKSTS